ncbi:MAG: phosphate ABC transporter permease subunit PstC [Spirochaetaceae bacterium]|nr:phosphate ABC transporter permease subunit PstC [Spirochaetaceae bacterium]
MSIDLQKRPFGSLKESGMKGVFLTFAFISIVTTIGIVLVLLVETADFFREVSIKEFVLGFRWSPTIKPTSFGVWPLVSGTLYFTFAVALIALPAGLLAAVFLSEYAGRRLRSAIKPALEILAGIPTVVYGYFALVYITPLLRTLMPGIKTFNVLSASIVVAIMIIPTVASISEDAIRAVPQSLRQAGSGLGVTKFQVTTTIVLPASLSGIISSFILGISRAIGETMAVTIAGGNLARLVNPFKPAEALLKPIQTMTAAMVEIGMSDVTGDSTAYKSLFAVGFTLFLMTLTLNVVSQIIKSRYQEKYQ